MNNTLSGSIRGILNDLEDELKRITGQTGSLCHHNPHITFFKLSYGIAQLEGMHRTSEEHRNEIIDLHSRYVNVSYKMFGDYYGSVQSE